MAHVDVAERAKAVELGRQLVEHQMNRLRDCLDRAVSLLDVSNVTNPDEALNEINRAANIAGRAQQATQMWKGLVIDWQRNNPNFIQAGVSTRTMASGAGPAVTVVDMAG